MTVADALRVLQDDYAEHGEHCDCRPCQALEELERATRGLRCTDCACDVEGIQLRRCTACWMRANMAATRA